MRQKVKSLFQSGGILLRENQNCGLFTSITHYLIGENLTKKTALGGDLQPGGRGHFSSSRVNYHVMECPHFFLSGFWNVEWKLSIKDYGGFIQDIFQEVIFSEGRRTKYILDGMVHTFVLSIQRHAWMQAEQTHHIIPTRQTGQYICTVEPVTRARFIPLHD